MPLNNNIFSACNYTFTLKMSYPYVIRNYCPKDLDDLVNLVNEAERLKDEHYISPQTPIESLGRLQDYYFEKDLFLAEIASNIIGYVNVTRELNIGRVVLSCLVHPRNRRKGLGTKLFGRAMRHAKQLGAKVAHTNIYQDNVVAKRFLSKLGFKFVRLYLELRLNFANVHLPDTDQPFLCRHLKPGEEDRLTKLQNRSFADTWGYNPNTVEEISYRTSLPDYSPRNIILAYEGDRPVGYCWTQADLDEKQANAVGGKKGRVYMLGVDPDCRGRGMGKMVLLAGLHHLKSKGFQIVEATVDSENKTANSLYRSIGFKEWTTSLWYEKTID